MFHEVMNGGDRVGTTPMVSNSPAFRSLGFLACHGGRTFRDVDFGSLIVARGWGVCVRDEIPSKQAPGAREIDQNILYTVDV
jgi:hypothetical protein